MSKPTLEGRTVLRFCLGFCLFTGSVPAQSPRVLTLDESIRLALTQGYAVLNATSNYDALRMGYESSLRSLRTSVSLSLDVPNFSESLSSQFNPITQRYEFYQITTTQMTSTLSVNQPIVWTGGTLSLRQFMFGRDQISGLASAASARRDYFSNFLLSFRQPLLTPNPLRITQERALFELQQAESNFLRTQLDIIYAVTESFYTTYQLARRVDITRETVNQNEDSYETARSKFNAGLIPEVEVLQSEVDLVTSRNDLLSAERELSRAENALRLLTGLPLETAIALDVTLTFTPVQIDQARATESALKSRTEVQNAAFAIELRRLDLDAAESRNDFRIDLTATYGLNKNDTDYRTVFQDFGTTQSAALTLSVPLFDWGAQSLEIEAAEVRHRTARSTHEFVRQQIRQEIMDLVNRVRVAESRIQVLEKSVSVAQKGYDISLERFRSGNIKRNDLAQAQQRLTNAKVSSLNALIDYRLGLADLKRKTLWDFQTNRPVRPEKSVEP